MKMLIRVKLLRYEKGCVSGNYVMYVNLKLVFDSKEGVIHQQRQEGSISCHHSSGKLKYLMH